VPIRVKNLRTYNCSSHRCPPQPRTWRLCI